MGCPETACPSYPTRMRRLEQFILDIAFGAVEVQTAPAEGLTVPVASPIPETRPSKGLFDE